uniref:Uncharacterized protein n=1 Tax=Anguilla anguilla TaxID=7936 RepID=A0A0E9URL0_ANGAN
MRVEESSHMQNSARGSFFSFIKTAVNAWRSFLLVLW